MYNQENWNSFDHMGNLMGGGVMFWVLILIVVIFAFSFLKNLTSNNSEKREDDSLNILKKRFANSEISEEEYLSKKATL